MKRFIPINNDICTVDNDRVAPLMHCETATECYEICDRLNGDNEDDKQRNSNKNTFEN